MLSVPQLREYIVRPTLLHLGLFSSAAENLLVGTALQESRLTYVDQLAPGPGPAYGLLQMERATHDDIWENYLRFNVALRAKVELTLAPWPSDKLFQMHTNNGYAFAMARVHYLRVREALPAADDVLGLARYWKRYYNTVKGKGTVDEFVENYRHAA